MAETEITCWHCGEVQSSGDDLCARCGELSETTEEHAERLAALEQARRERERVLEAIEWLPGFGTNREERGNVGTRQFFLEMTIQRRRRFIVVIVLFIVSVAFLYGH